MDTLTLAEAADMNFAVHASWAPRRVTGMHVRDEPDLVVVDSGLPGDMFNIVCRARLNDEQEPRRVEEAIGYFRAAGRPFSWWVGPADRPPALGEILVAGGLVQAETELAMAADLAALRTVDVAPDGLLIRRARTAPDLRDFASVIAATSSPPDLIVPQFYVRAAPHLLAPDAPQWFYVGYVAGEPVATAELTVGGGMVGLYGIATLEGHRRRGCGTALTLRPLLDARAQGFHTAVLQATADGAGIYARVGFEPFGRVAEYKPVSSVALE